MQKKARKYYNEIFKPAFTAVLNEYKKFLELNKLDDKLDDDLHIQQEIPAITLAMEEDYIKNCAWSFPSYYHMSVGTKINVISDEIDELLRQLNKSYVCMYNKCLMKSKQMCKKKSNSIHEAMKKAFTD